MSRAALMADGSWGNAELVAAQSLSAEQADKLLSDLTILGECGDFPETPPSNEWEIQPTPLRIVAARFSNGVIEIRFTSDREIFRLVIEMDDKTRQECSDFAEGSVARIRVGKCPKSVRLHNTLKSGEVVSSEFSWVDDEDSLGISVPERRIAAKLAEAAEAGSLSAGGLFEILQLLHQHLQEPDRQAAPWLPQEGESASRPGPSYCVEDVFSDSFGRPRNDPVARLPGGFRETDFLNAFAAYFSVGAEEWPGEEDHPPPGELQTDDKKGDGQEPEEVGNEKAREELERRQTKRRRSEEALRLRKKLLAALENVIEAMGADEFVCSRSPERLGADIAATALLLRKGLVDEIISEDDFAEITKRLWIVLFFGSKEEPSVFQNHLDSRSTEERTAFETAVASPRLTAALTLWCFPDWSRDSTEAVRFRFSAMLLAGRLPWLVVGGSVEEIYGELRRLARAMPGGAEFEALAAAWASWRQAGIAFQEFERAVSKWGAKELAEAVTRDHVNRGELLWQAGEFCVANSDYRRDQGTKAIVHSLTRASQSKIVGNFLAPVSDLLSDMDLLPIDDRPRKLLRSILAEVETLELAG